VGRLEFRQVGRLPLGGVGEEGLQVGGVVVGSSLVAGEADVVRKGAIGPAFLLLLEHDDGRPGAHFSAPSRSSVATGSRNTGAGAPDPAGGADQKAF